MFINNYNKLLQLLVSRVEILAYTISILIILLSVIYSTYIFVKEIHTPEKAYSDTKVNLMESVSLALSFLLCVEVLKVYYVKNYKQLIIVVSLVLMKVILAFLLNFEINVLHN